MESYSLIFSVSIETWACLVCEVSVAPDYCMGICFLQLLQQIDKCCDLCQCARVLRREFLILSIRNVFQTSDVRDTDADSVVPLAMRSNGVNITTIVNATVTIDDVVVADVTESSVLDVILTDLLHCVILSLRRCCAVDDNFCNCALALLKPEWEQECQSLRTYYAICGEMMLELEFTDCFCRNVTVYTIDDHFPTSTSQCLLNLLNHVAAATFLVQFHVSRHYLFLLLYYRD